MYQKRIAMPKNWQMPKKEKKYIINSRAGQNKNYSVPILIILRDLAKVVNNTKEGKIALKQGDVLVNNKKITDTKFSVGILDKVYIKKEEKYFILTLNNKGIVLKEISAKDYSTKITKIIDKRILKGKKVQINCFDGRNFLYDKELKVGDSLLIDTVKNEIIKVLPLKKGAKIFAIKGKHMGKEGTIQEIEEKEANVLFNDEKAKIRLESLMIIE
jgi:small subunit ribosomal protein S4e